MNKMKIIGLVLSAIGMISILFFEDDMIGITGALFTGAGIGLLFTKSKK